MFNIISLLLDYKFKCLKVILFKALLKKKNSTQYLKCLEAKIISYKMTDQQNKTV